jgi:SAM-dependent methyltransferase
VPVEGGRSGLIRNQQTDDGPETRLAPEPSLNEILRDLDRAWHERPVLRRLYREWDQLVVSQLAPVDGPTVELGSGIGHFSEICPQVVATDVEPTDWTSVVVDAEAMPYEDASVANLVLIDVFHHLGRPAAFLDEASRVLAPGGRAVILDPYCSAFSTWAYRRFHFERTDLDVRPFEADAAVAASPMESNQALATLVFFHERGLLEQRWPELAVIERRRLALFVYPLSGGFGGTRFVRPALLRPAEAVERLLTPLTPLIAFRCLVVLERRPANISADA